MFSHRIIWMETFLFVWQTLDWTMTGMFIRFNELPHPSISPPHVDGKACDDGWKWNKNRCIHPWLQEINSLVAQDVLSTVLHQLPDVTSLDREIFQVKWPYCVMAILPADSLFLSISFQSYALALIIICLHMYMLAHACLHAQIHALKTHLFSSAYWSVVFFLLILPTYHQ